MLGKKEETDVLAVRKLGVEVDNTVLLHEVSFTLKKGRTLCVVGESGSGKTTLLKALQGLMPICRGSVEHGLDRPGATTRQEPGPRPIGLPDTKWVMQNPIAALNPLQKAGAAITESLHHAKLDRDAKREALLAALGDVDLLPEMALRYPAQLSLGQAQRVCIARALIARPELILFDEPLSALDAVVQKQVGQTMERIKQTHGLSYIVVTHDLGYAQAYADEILLLRNGVVEAYQTCDAFFRSPDSDYGSELIEAARVLGCLPEEAAVQPMKCGAAQ